MHFTKAVRSLMTYSAEFLWVKSYMVLAVEAYYEKIGQISINYPENNCIWLQRPDWGTAVGCLVTQLFSTLCGPMDCSTPGFLVLHHLPEFAQTHVYWVRDAIQPSHPLSPHSLALNLSQHQGLFQRVGSLHQMAKVLELQLQHQSFQCIFRIDFL